MIISSADERRESNVVSFVFSRPEIHTHTHVRTHLYTRIRCVCRETPRALSLWKTPDAWVCRARARVFIFVADNATHHVPRVRGFLPFAADFALLSAHGCRGSKPLRFLSCLGKGADTTPLKKETIAFEHQRNILLGQNKRIIFFFFNFFF